MGINIKKSKRMHEREVLFFRTSLFFFFPLLVRPFGKSNEIKILPSRDFSARAYDAKAIVVKLALLTNSAEYFKLSFSFEHKTCQLYSAQSLLLVFEDNPPWRAG